ncbi:MAG: hypothetical protein LBL95_00995, partial [Deltaproteobacteria bacterium]|nr:hypothetical protein [Deltaproteobacteria bacterium]
ACLERFGEIPVIKAQDMAFRELKKRNNISKTNFARIPPQLKSTIYFAGLSRKLPQLEKMLQSYYKG